jgi:hypothetical protein
MSIDPDAPSDSDPSSTPPPDPRIVDAFSFADSLISFGCTMRDHFLRTFSSAWERLPHPPNVRDVNFTASISGFLGRHIRLRERVAALTGSIVLNFPAETNIFEGEDEIDFFGPNRGGDKFLGRWSRDELTAAITNSSLGNGIRMAGIDDWYLEFDLRDSFVHYGYMRRLSLPEPQKFLGFLIVQLGEFRIRRNDQINGRGLALLHSKLPSDLNMLNIRWFSLQNPLAEFSAKRPRMPGQRYPGTGFARSAFDLLRSLATANARDGLVNVPEHFHNAFLYEGFHFLNADDEGQFQRMRDDLAKDIDEKGLAAVSWAVFLGFLRCNGQKVPWEPREQVYGISSRLEKYFKSGEYVAALEGRKAEAGPFEIDWAAAERYCLSAVLNFSADEVKGAMEPAV